MVHVATAETGGIHRNDIICQARNKLLLLLCEKTKMVLISSDNIYIWTVHKLTVAVNVNSYHTNNRIRKMK